MKHVNFTFEYMKKNSPKKLTKNLHSCRYLVENMTAVVVVFVHSNCKHVINMF